MRDRAVPGATDVWQSGLRRSRRIRAGDLAPLTPGVSVAATIDQSAVSLSLACTNGTATGSIQAQWNGTAFVGPLTFADGASSGTASITRSGGSSPPSVQWYSTIQLTAFISQVDAQRGNKLSEVEADMLIQAATDANAALGCS